MKTHHGIHHCHWACTVLTAAHGADFKLVTGECERRGTVSVRVVEFKIRQFGDQVERAFHFLAILIFAFGNLVEKIGQGFADEDRDNCRGSFIGAQSVIITGVSDTGAQYVGILVNSRNSIDEESQEAEVSTGIFAWREQVDTCIGTHTPVIVLAGAVYACERFLVEKHAQFVTACHAIHEVHEQLVVIHCYVNFLIYRCDFVLSRRYLIVAGTHRDTQFMAFSL